MDQSLVSIIWYQRQVDYLILGTVTMKSWFNDFSFCEIPRLVNIFLVLANVHINSVQWNLWSWPHFYRTSKSILICTWPTHLNLTTCMLCIMPIMLNLLPRSLHVVTLLCWQYLCFSKLSRQPGWCLSLIVIGHE